MNIIQLQDALKDFSEDQLIREMQQPSGNAPQYLVLTEIERRQKLKQNMQSQQGNEPTVAEEAVSRKMPAQNSAIAESMTRPSPAVQPMKMSGGGIAKFQNRGYVPSSELLRAIAMQESRMDPRAVGEAGEIGMFQIMPTTAIDPGYGIPSLFPELQAQIGQGKKFATAQEAYTANKDLIDEVLFNPKQSEQFAKSYLDVAKSRFPDDEARAIAAYNVGMGGAEKLEDPLSFPYVEGVGSYIESPAERVQAPFIPGISAAQASTSQPTSQPVDTSAMTDKERWLYLSGRSRQFLTPEQKEDLFNLQKEFGRAPDVMKPEAEEMLSGVNQFLQENILDPAQKYIGDPIREFLDENVATPIAEGARDIAEVATAAVEDPERAGAYLVSTPEELEQFDKDRAKRLQEEAIARAEESGDATRRGSPMDEVLPAGDPAVAAEVAAETRPAPTQTDTTGMPTVNELLMELRDRQRAQVDAAKEDEEFNRYLAIAQMGAKLAEGKGPFVGAIGEAIGEGLPTLAAARQGVREAEKESLQTDIDIAQTLADAESKQAFGLEDRLRVANAMNDDIINLQKQIDQLAPFGSAITPQVQMRIDEKLGQIAALQRDRQLLIGGYGFGATPTTTGSSSQDAMAQIDAAIASKQN